MPSSFHSSKRPGVLSSAVASVPKEQIKAEETSQQKPRKDDGSESAESALAASQEVQVIERLAESLASGILASHQVMSYETLAAELSRTRLQLVMAQNELAMARTESATCYERLRELEEHTYQLEGFIMARKDGCL